MTALTLADMSHHDIDYGLPLVKIGPGVASCVGELTPALAKQLLANNDGNRILRNAPIEKYRADILADRWRLNGEPIIFTTGGRMLSGQHRCHAVVRAGESIITVFTQVIDDEVMATIDQGASRTVGDALRFGGAATKHAPTLRLLNNYLLGRNMTIQVTAPLSGPAAVELVDKLPGIHTSVQVAGRIYTEIGGSKAAYAAFHFLASKTPYGHGEFFDRLKDGVGLDAKSPILHMRKRIVKERSAGEVRYASVVWPLLIKSWNAWIGDRAVGVLRFGTTETVEAIAGIPDEWRFGAWKS